MTRFLVIVSVALLLAPTSCGHKQSAPPAATPETQAQPAAAETAQPQPLDGQVDAFMTGQLRIFVQQNGRLPKDFAEFSHARLDSVPRTPLGMKWAIDLATQEVKLVKE
ncbi:MAG TPA: hypothetical protein VN578_16820 [Candidatus Binatia bacterium]|jgi:hypothetical protein|nr:hypothetical protein [Candidatus Binatia bacterium]